MLLKKDSSERITAQNALDHEFFCSNDIFMMERKKSESFVLDRNVL